MSLVPNHIFLILFFIFTSITPSLIASELEESKAEKNPTIITYRTRVYIRNDLGESDSLTIHCKSKTKDLGVQVLQENTSFQWRFRIDFFERTLYWCGFSWRDGGGSFDVFIAKRDISRCETNCTWSARIDGLHGYNQRSGVNDITFPWVV